MGAPSLGSKVPLSLQMTEDRTAPAADPPPYTPSYQRDKAERAGSRASSRNGDVCGGGGGASIIFVRCSSHPETAPDSAFDTYSAGYDGPVTVSQLLIPDVVLRCNTTGGTFENPIFTLL